MRSRRRDQQEQLLIGADDGSRAQSIPGHQLSQADSIQVRNPGQGFTTLDGVVVIPVTCRSKFFDGRERAWGWGEGYISRINQQFLADL